MVLKPFDDTHRDGSIYLSRFLEREREEKRRGSLVQANYRIPRLLKDALKTVAVTKGMTVERALEQAIFDWIERNRPPHITMNVYQPVSVQIDKITLLEVQETEGGLRNERH